MEDSAGWGSWGVLTSASGEHGGVIMLWMATFRISEADAARDFAALMARARAGEEIAIESGSGPVIILSSRAAHRRTTEEVLELLPKNSPAIIDEDFEADVAAAVAAHREPLNPPAWD